MTWCYIGHFARDMYENNGIGGEVRHGVTSGVSCETSKNNYVKPHLHREYNTGTASNSDAGRLGYRMRCCNQTLCRIITTTTIRYLASYDSYSAVACGGARWHDFTGRDAARQNISSWNGMAPQCKTCRSALRVSLSVLYGMWHGP